MTKIILFFSCFVVLTHGVVPHTHHRAVINQHVFVLDEQNTQGVCSGSGLFKQLANIFHHNTQEGNLEGYSHISRDVEKMIFFSPLSLSSSSVRLTSESLPSKNNPSYALVSASSKLSVWMKNLALRAPPVFFV